MLPAVAVTVSSHTRAVKWRADKRPKRRVERRVNEWFKRMTEIHNKIFNTASSSHRCDGNERCSYNAHLFESA